MGMTLKFSFNTILCMICFLFGVYGNIACLTEVVVEVKFILKMRSLLKCGLSLIFSTFHHSSFTFLFFIIQKTRVQRCIMSMSVSNSHCSNPSRITLWFRNDLRLDDNPIVYEAMQSIAAGKASEVLPVYTFDPRWFSQTEWKNGNLKTGHFRAQYLLGSVLDLKNRLRDIGSDLVICMGAPEEVLPPLALGGRVLAQAEVTSQEIQAENCVSRALKRQQEKKGCLELYWGSTLFHKDDLPFSQENGLADMPNVFTPFRQKCEDKSSVRKLLPGPTKNSLPLPKDLEISLLQFSPSSIEDLNEIVPKGHPKLRASAAIPDSRSALCFKGGETEALERLKYYVWESNLVSKYFEIRNGMIGGDYSTKLSPALAHGCISPRRIYHEIKKYEAQREANKSTYWVIFELIWRDYFKFFAMKHGNSIFRLDGTASGKARNVTWSNDLSLLGLWKEGSTGWPLVDANMREMAATGWMSNRGRQNVASFLALDLGVDWRLGADWFESELIDYDVASNWGNWVAAAGLTGGRINKFNITKQSKDYDPNGDYIRLWIPELAAVPSSRIHEPWLMSKQEQDIYNCHVGEDYPHPLKARSSEAGARKGNSSRRIQSRFGNNSAGGSRGNNKGRRDFRARSAFELYG